MSDDRARRRYRTLLRLTPERLRHRHAAEMEDAFIEAWHRARTIGRIATAWTWMRAAADLGLAAIRRPVPVPRSIDPSARRSPLMIGTDIRYALRAFRRQRLATGLVVTMLTLAMAANVVVFSLINGLFLRPFPFPESERLVYINERAPQWNLDRTGINYPDFDQWRKATRAFEGLALFDSGTFNMADEGGAERIAGARVTHDFFPLLRIQPLRGRLFTAEDDRPNGPRVVLISEVMWQERFGRDEAVLEKTIRLNGVTFQILGVLPRHAEFPTRSRVWIPLAGDPNQQDKSYSYDGIGRLKPDITVASAEEDLRRAHEPIWEARDRDRVVSPFAEPLRETLIRDFRTMTRALFGAVTLLLVVACANVAAVMLARAIARRREMGVRLAVGASRWRLLRQLFVENMLLAVAGGILGLVVGRWALSILIAAAGAAVPAWASFAMDGRLVGFAVLVTVATAVLFGWAPAFHAVRGNLRSAMTDASPGSTTSPRGRRTLTWLVAAEFALAAVLLVGGGLLFRAFSEVRRVDPGFRADHVLTFSVSLPAATYPDGPARLAFWTRLLERVRAMPGIESAGVISCPPLGCHWGNFYRIEGRPPLKPGEADPVVLSRMASEGYAAAMGLRLVAGRFFDERDGLPNTPGVVVVNESFVRTFWPGTTDAIGKRMSFTGANQPWLTVVGVTADVKHYGLERPMRPGLYFPARQLAFRTARMTVVMRTVNEPDAFAGTARALVRELDPTLPLFSVQTMERALSDSLQQRATYSWMLAVFAGLALVLALGGTYGVTSYLVSQRHREIGIRLAMGARSTDIIRGVVRGSLAPIGAGVIVGLASAMALASLINDLFFGVSPRDPIVLLTAAAALGIAALGANWLPARRAARTDPMGSLRT